MGAIDNLKRAFVFKTEQLENIIKSAQEFFDGNCNTGGIIAHVRHNCTNYDRIRKSRLIKPYQRIMFKQYVNDVIREELQNKGV